MSPKSKKRPADDSEDESRDQSPKPEHAECPYKADTLSHAVVEVSDAHKSKKQRQNVPNNGQKAALQPSPFQIEGTFKTTTSLDSYFDVTPRKEWYAMTRYNSFVLNNIKYLTDDFIYVSNATTVLREDKKVLTADGSDKANEYWVARLLEIRAKSANHVYARIYWMYWPEDLANATVDGVKRTTGRQPHHGQHELIASNHMEIINVISVAGPVKVEHWKESDDDAVQDALYWRQGLDYRNNQLSSINILCVCSMPANPDHVLVGCSNKKCEMWLHNDCLLDVFLTKVYNTLGTDIPHTAANGDATGKTTPTRVNKGESKSPGTVSSRRKKGKKPYEGLFKASLTINEGPIIWEVEDLRQGITGGDKIWTESARCPKCDALLI